MTAQPTLFDDASGEAGAGSAGAHGGEGVGGGREGPGRRRFTDEQAAAIAARRGSRVLSANAGSGKTAVVVERFARAVREDGVDPRRILAITFTEKAAGELRQRLRERFVELGDRAAARAAEGAFVSTIHGFCARLLRSHPLAAGLDPAFRVLDVAEAARLRADAFDAAFAAFLDSAAGTGPEALELSAAYRPDRLFGLVEDVHDRLRSRGDAEPSLPDPGERPVPPEARERLRRAHAAAAACLAGAGDGQSVTRARAALERAAAWLESGDGGGVPALADLAAAAFKAGNTAVLRGPECCEYLEALESYSRAVADHLAVPACRRIGELLRAYGREYAERKHARGGLDFEDLELMARDLLERDAAVRAAWRSRFELVMVDEFQDVNRRQLAILELLEDDNLLTVGDELQSIYGFRHADVEIFRGRRDRLAAAGGAGQLRASFRAREPLLDVINAAFAPVFGERFTPLTPGRADAAERPGPLVELLVTDQRGWDGAGLELGDGLPPAPAWRHAEARLLAQRVRELVDAGEIEPGGTAVLVRALTDLAVYERALEDQGLRTYVAGGRGYWSGQQVGDLLAYLGALANPRDETRMFALLTSPLAGLSSDGLAALAAARRDADRHAWSVLEAAFAPQDQGRGEEGEDRAAAQLAARLPAADAERMRAFCPWFADERRGMARRSLEELLERAITARDYDLHALGLRGGARRMANVRKLLRLAREYEAHEGRDVRGFLDSAELRREVQAAEGEAPVEPEDLDAVRLMTIHGAKGLEFDTVCVADLGRPGRGDHPDLHVGDGGRIGLRLLTLEGNGGVKALDFEALQAERDAADEAEEHRVFYVAMTRARERLVVSGAVPNAESWPRPALTAPPLAWAGPALAPAVPETLTERAPVWESPTGVVCRLNAPATVGRVLDPAAATPARAPAARPAPAVAPPTAELVEVPVARAPAVPTLSYSGLDAYARCGYRFYVERVLRLGPDRDPAPATGPAAPATPAAAIDPRLRGSLAHLLLERIDLAGAAQPAAGDVLALAAELGARVGEPEAAEIAGLAAAFVRSPLGRRLGASPRLRREAPFAFPLRLPAGEVLVNGFVDADVRDGGRALIVDYKSDRVEPGEDLAARTRRDYGTQRLVYGLAALRDGATEVEVVHAYLERPEAPVGATFEAADAPRLEAELAALAAGIADERFEVTAQPHRGLCHDCPARRGLCSWDEHSTLRDAAPA